jgi:hypothetical protein
VALTHIQARKEPRRPAPGGGLRAGQPIGAGPLALSRRINPQLLVALALALAFHGSLVFYSFPRTYDAYVHIFFADHYARAWFDHWDYRWYTGFPMTSYPPGAQQSIALFSYAVGLRNGFIIVQTLALLNMTVGIYRFSRIWVSEEAAGYAALLLVFSSSIVETVHVFGQLPTTFSLGFLLNALPFVYRWIHEGRLRYLLLAWACNAATTAGHHVTTLFGAVFFVAPVIALALVESLRRPRDDEPLGQPSRISWANLRPLAIRRLRRVLPSTLRAGLYGVGMIGALVLVVLPYWLWSRADPITQVAIPHSSRDSFIVNTNAGLVFWLIPYGLGLLGLPYAFYKGLTTRAWPMTLSLGMLVLLGTGGTTPIPRLLLRGAFDVLTLDRFTFWATITVLPLLGELVLSLRHGGLARYLREQFGTLTLRISQLGLIAAYLLIAVFVANLTQFRRFQPAAIEVQPIVTFLEKDDHWRWRYLTLGFGDQVAWLGAQTTATSVDGNYHSARRLPELTSTPVERLEGAKFRGIPGIGSLQQFLAVPEKYNLKFVLSVDQFYDPLLYFSGWHRLQRLENGVMIWERADIPALPDVLPRKEIPIYQRVMWGLVPMSALFNAIIMLALYAALRLRTAGMPTAAVVPPSRLSQLRKRLLHRLLSPWRWLDTKLLRWSALPASDQSPQMAWQVWLGWIRAQHLPRPAPPSAHQLRSAMLVLIVLCTVAVSAANLLRQADSPRALVEAYYDDLDFRRFAAAYARLDPQTRPNFERYMIDLTARGGLVASYGKLDSVSVQLLSLDGGRAEVAVALRWITALREYPTSQHLSLVRRDGHWYVVPEKPTLGVPPDLFVRRATLEWHIPNISDPEADPSLPPPSPDRPTLEVLSARLVRVGERYSVVGELANTAADPGDVTVTALLFDQTGAELSRYNAQTGIMHKLLPGEVTPFQVNFEGVAGAMITETLRVGTFRPDDFTPLNLKQPVTSFAVYGKAVVTARDLRRELSAQDLKVAVGPDGGITLSGALYNSGTVEATIPQILVTCYDQAGQVAWVEEVFIEEAVLAQERRPFRMALHAAASVVDQQVSGTLFPLGEPRALGTGDQIMLPPGSGYAAIRISVHAFAGAGP